MTRIAALLISLAVHGAALAQAPAPAPAPALVTAPAAATPVDPARLAAARALIDVLMPPATRETMLQGIIAPMHANIRRGMEENREFASEMRSDPRIKAVFDKFMAKQEARTVTTMRDALPGMVPAMATAYARRFTVAQMAEIRTFFETPTGRTYMQASFTIMNDPDIQAWQRQMMARAMAGIQQDIAAMTAEVDALGAKTP